nr:E3 ubiquitin-protein ligase RNF123-like [Megalopta genalis]
MEIDEIVMNIFEQAVRSDLIGSRISDALLLLDNYIEIRLASIPIVSDKREGRIGRDVVVFDSTTHVGLTTLSQDGLSITSGSRFSTLKANTAVFKGKWMYELQLGSRGVMQVGWSTINCRFNQEKGVGDTVNSYAYDGNHLRKWNVSTYKYGESWLTGDIIGCALDMDNRTINFYRNGTDLGRAFENIAMGSGIAYFPTVSLSLEETLKANFGSTPMRYPVEGYEPLQLAPEKEITKATYLFNWLQRIIHLLNKEQHSDKQNMLPDGTSVSIFLMCLSRLVFKHVGSLITVPYITEYIVIPFMQQLSEHESFTLITCLDLLWTFLEDHEMEAFLENTVSYLHYMFRHVSPVLEYPDQFRSLHLLISISRHTRTRQFLLQYLLIDRVRFTDFIDIKPLDEKNLTNVVGNVTSYLEACEKIKAAISELEKVQTELLVIFLDNSDGNEKKPTSRTIFLRRFRYFIKKNTLSNCTPLPIALSCFHRLLIAFKKLWDEEVGTSPVYVPCRAFYDASIDYFTIERLGGVLSHLNKTFKSELVEKLGSDYEVVASQEYTRGSILIFERFESCSYVMEEIKPLKLGPLDSATSLLELLDGIILFYYVLARKQLADVTLHRNKMSGYVAALEDDQTQLEQIKNNEDSESRAIQEALLRQINVFKSKLAEQTTYMAWARAVLYTEEKEAQFVWLLQVVTRTLNNASKEGNLFSFTPIFYLDTQADLYKTLRNHLYPAESVESISRYRETLQDIAVFLCEHFMDPRIVNANSKIKPATNLACFLINPLALEAVESIQEESRTKVVRNLLKSYVDDGPWAQSTWILLKFWHGNGFAFRYVKSPHLSERIELKLYPHIWMFVSLHPTKPCPSAVYQNHVRDVLLDNPQESTKYLNFLLNHANWSFSEFIRILQEICDVAVTESSTVAITNVETLSIFDTCFMLTICLLHVLEMIVTVAPSIFNSTIESSSEYLLSRLCQLLCQVLNRITSQSNCFQQIILLKIPGFDTMDHFPILAAVTGVLLALLKDDMTKSKSQSIKVVPEVTRTLLNEPSFQLSSLHFLLGNTNSESKNEKLKPFSFELYPEDVSKEEIQQVQEMIEYLEHCQSILPDSKVVTDDDNVCTICYAYPIAVTFEPCRHQTCRTCIDQHLFTARECFFCKAAIEKVVDLSGNTVHDFTDSTKKS